MASDSGNRLLLFIAFLLTVVASSAVTASFMKSNISDEALGQRVAQFIVENPEVIANSLRRAQQIETDRLTREAQKSIGDKRAEIDNDANTPVAGNPEGDVVVVEFFDYNCGYCKKVADDLAKLVNEHKNVKLVLKEFPILGPVSEVAARAGIAGYRLDKDKYFKLHMALLHAAARDEAAILKVAEGVGYNADKLKKEMASKEVDEQINKHRSLGQAIGIRGTPSFVINGQLQRGALDYAALKGLIEDASKK
jgi:protein-disulfide isomerase